MFTPNHIVFLARLIAVALLVPLVRIYIGIVPADWSASAGLTLALGATALMALPRLRSGDILAILAVGITLSEAFLAAFLLEGDVTRWLTSMAALGTLALPFKLQQFRSMASKNRYMSLADWQAHEQRGRSKGLRVDAGLDVVVPKADAIPIR